MVNLRFPISNSEDTRREDTEMKYILILGLALSSISTTAFAVKPTGTPGPSVTDDDGGGGPATVNIEHPGKKK